MIRTASIIFHGELTGLVRRRGRAGRTDGVEFDASRRASVKDVIESLGVPHTEVYGVAAGGLEVDFSHIPAPGEVVEVDPGRPPVDVTRPTPLRPRGCIRGRFLLDASVGKLATLLRLCGFDARGAPGLAARELAGLAAADGRVILSRDTALLRVKEVVHARLVRGNDPRDQLRDVLDFFGLTPPYAAFSRCLRCNLALTPVAKEAVLDRLEPKTRLYYHDFFQCQGCGRVYWPGSHHEAMLAVIGELAGDLERGRGGA